MAHYVSKITAGWYEYRGYTLTKDSNTRQSRVVDNMWHIAEGTSLNKRLVHRTVTKNEAIAWIDNKLNQNTHKEN